MKEKFDTDIDCLEGYNTGYNKNIDAYVLHDVLEKSMRQIMGILP